MKAIVMLCFLLFACGPQQDFTSTCPARPKNGVEVWAEFALDCSAVSRNIATARSILHSRGIVPTGEFWLEFENVPVRIHDVEYVSYTSGIGNIGTYNPFDGIHLARDGTALLHEMLHKVDLARGGVLTHDHFEWDKRGWLKADGEFVALSVSLRMK